MNHQSKITLSPCRLVPLSRSLAVLACIFAGTLISCEVGPNYHRPNLQLSTTYKSETQPASQPAIGTNWWQLFNDRQLTALEEAATKYNPDLQAAMQRVIQARNAAKSVKSQFYPAISLDPSYTHAESGSNRAVGGGKNVNTARIPFDLTYEVDIWGRVRRSVESATAAAEASADDYFVILQTLQSDVAQNYFNLRSLDTQSQILLENVDLYRRQLALIQKQKDVGIAAATDVLQVQTLLDSTIAQEIDIRRQRNDLEHALAILTGRPPSALSIPVTPLVELPPVIPAGLPSDLLLRRPDVAQAEQNLIAASANIGVAKAEFFPKLSLTASAGLSSIDLATILAPTSRFSTIGPSLSFPIFTGGALEANLAQARARFNELYATYRSTVLSALGDVENSLNDLHYFADRALAQDRAVASSQEYLRLTEVQKNQGGLISELQLLDADRTLLTNQLTANQILTQRQISTVLLIKALGGGWQAPASSTQPHARLTTLPSDSPTTLPATVPAPLPIFPTAQTAPATLP